MTDSDQRYHQLMRQGSIISVGNYNQHMMRQSQLGTGQNNVPASAAVENDPFQTNQQANFQANQPVHGGDNAAAAYQGMSADERQRIEVRRQQEQGRSRPLEESNNFQPFGNQTEMQINQQFAQQTNLRLLGCIIVLILVFKIYTCEGIDSWNELAKVHPSLHSWYSWNLMIYLITYWWQECAVRNYHSTEDRARFLRNNNFFSILIIVFSINFIIKMRGHEMQDYLNCKENRGNPKIQSMATTVEIMVQMRLIPFYFLGCACAIILCVLCCVLATGQRTQQQHINRLPLVSNFISSHTRKFNPIKDKSEECSICLCNFNATPDQEIVQLNCKHIFHANCLMEWVQQNDICPLCREPIVN